MQLPFGCHSVGGAFIVNKAKYFEVGGENEKFYGFGPEDTERIKRLEIMSLKIHYSYGEMFHLVHPRGKSGWYENENLERNNRTELLKICKFHKTR